MDSERNRWGLPACPADAVMRGTTDPAPTPSDPVEGQRQPRPWKFALAMVWAVLMVLLVAGCGGEVKTTVDLTEDPPVEVRWEIELLKLCDETAEDRVAELNRVNNAHLNHMFLLVACPGADPLNTDAKAILYNGVPAMAIQAQIFYLFPSMGEQAQSTAPALTLAPILAPKAGRIPLTRMGATLP